MPRVDRRESLVASFGAGLIACALLANQRWLDRHVLPSFFLMRRWYVFAGVQRPHRDGAFGGWLLALVARPRIGRFTARHPAGVISGVIAALLALGAGELVLTLGAPVHGVAGG